MVQTIDLNNLLGNFPTDCVNQQVYMNNLLNVLNNNINVLNVYPILIQLDQEFEPTQDEWENEWTSQGYTLPISPTATLVWWDTYSGSAGGFYGTILGQTTVYRREHSTPRGATVYHEQAYRDDTQSFTTSITANDAIMPALTFTLPCICDLYVTFFSFITLSAGSGFWGVDAKLDGVQLGQLLYGVQVGYGVAIANTTSELYTEMLVKDVSPGEHTVQSMLGVVGNPGSPPTIQVAANRILTVRAIAK